METLTIHLQAPRPALGRRATAIVGVVGSGDLEVLAERVLAAEDCQIEISTAVSGFGPVWQAVAEDFVERRSPGGIRFSINDGGARPDIVAIRLAQAARLIEEDRP